MQPEPQEMADRVFVKVPRDTVARISTDDRFYFRGVRVAPNGSLLVWDGVSNQILSLSESGEVIARWGEGLGKGPGEHQAIENFGVGRDGNLWTFDISLNRVNVFSESGRLLKTVRFEENNLQQAILTDDGFVGFSLFDSPNFTLFDEDGIFLSQHGQLTSGDEGEGLAFVGHLRSFGSEIVFVGMRHPILIGIQSDDGSIRYHRESMQKNSVEPEVSATERGYSIANMSEIRFEQRILNVWNETVYIVLHEFDDANVYVDAFNSSSGVYQYSIRVPMSTGCVPRFLTDTHQYSSCDGDLVVIKRNDQYASS